MDPTGFFIIGAILAVIGVVLVLSGRKSMRRRKRIISTPTTPIAKASGGLIEVNGRIVASEQGMLVAPFSGRPAVWARVRVEEHRGSGKNSRWVTIVNETDERHFFVDDGSGELARVIPTSAEVLLDLQKVASSGTFNDAPPHLEQFLASRGIATTGFFGFNKSLRYEEALLCPGDALYAIGRAERAGGAGAGPFRQGPPGQLVFQHQGPDERELILTNKTEAQLVSSLRLGTIVGYVMLGIGGALLGAGGLASM
jgi:hypothetical protein